jgi:endonuclease/exonuclease/phosphatase family metal-dependent hydrolase
MPKMWPYTGAEVVADAPPARVKVLSYNLYWWNLFKARKGNKASAGKLISASSSAVAFDVMGFQECQDPRLVLADAALLPYYQFFLGPHSTCVAFRNGTWALLGRGDREVAEDGTWIKNQYYGRRSGQWLRLRHLTSGRILFFVNHHGPLPVNSGGTCGGVATAYNLLNIVNDHAQKGDAVIIVGDFNAVANSTTVTNVQTELHKLYEGSTFGGVDNMFANVNAQHVVERSNYGGGGSDHAALGMVLELRSEGAFLAPHGLAVGSVMS